MIPILYEHSETQFRSNGIGRLNCVSCIVTEERNGIYECEFTISVDDPIFPKIKEGQIIACIHDDRKDIQPFDIYGRSEPINGAVTFYAHHISYRLTKIMLEPYSASTCAQAIALIPSRSVNNNPFTFWTDKQTEGNFVLKVPQSVKATLGGVEGSILDTFGSAEYELDKFTVKLYQHRGTDTGVDIRYGKNLLNFVHDKDESGTYNAVFPFWYNEQDDTLIVLSDRLVISSDVVTDILLLTEDGKQLVTEDGKQLIADVVSEDVNAVPLDLTTYFETEPTEEQLREKATAILSGAEAREGTENFTVDFQALWQTDEYKDVAPLQRLSLCDYANITHGKLGISKLKQQIIRVEYDVLRERYQRMELGKARASFVDTVRAEVVNRTKDVPNMTTLQAALDNATALIKGGLGGYKVEITDADGHPMETLYMDTPNIETAMNILRINRNGIAFSRNGYNAESFVSAWTIDGHFAADFIDTGVLTANIIRAGILTDLLGNNYWNLDTGEFRLTGYPTDTQMASAISTAETNAKNYSDNALNNYQETVNAIVADLQDQIDGQIESWYYDYEPTMNNAPASSWTTEDDRKAHEGDVFYWQSQGYSYRFVKSNGSWGWSLIQDSDISMAIATANNALELAGNKRRIFVSQPVPPYDMGDLWTQGSNGDIKVCTTARSSGNYAASDWVNASKYTDDTALTTFLSGAYATDIQNIQSQIDGKIETFYQAADPSTGWASADKTKHTGDLWYKTSDNSTWRWNGSAWVEQEAPQAVFDAIDGKVNIFYGTPSGTYTGVHTGDYLVDSTDGSTYRYNGSAWTKVTDYSSAISTGIAAYDATQDQLAIYNKLTNNGQTQGIYLQNGRLYINAEYLTSGTIADSTGKTYWDLDSGEFVGTFAMQDKYVYNYHGTLIASKTGRSDIGIKMGYYVNPYGTYSRIDGASRPYNKETILGAIQSCFDNKASKYLFYRSLFMGDTSATPNGEAIDTTITEKQAARSVVLTTDSLTEDVITGDSLLENYCLIRETYRQTVNSGYNVEVINDVVGYGDFDGVYYLEKKNDEGYYNKVGHALISLLTTGNYKGIEIESNGTYFRLTPTTCVIYADSGVLLRYYSSYWRIEGSGRSGAIAVASTSSKRYKHDIKPLEDEELDPHRLYDLTVKQFVYNDDAELQYWDMRGLTMAGFIAEDVAEIYPSATIRDYETKQIESWDERRIIPPMLSLIQEQKKEIDELRSEVDKLKKLVNQILKEREE